MPYDPNEVALLRQLIVEEQQKMKKPKRGKGKCGKSKKQGCECSDDEDELRGGFIGAVVGAIARAALPAIARVGATAARIGSTAARVLPRVGSTAARSTAIVPYNAARAAASVARTTAPSMASRAASAAARGIRSQLTLGNALSVGVPVGATIYQSVDYEKQKKLGEAQAAEAERLNQLAMEDNRRAVDAEIEFYKEQQRLVELDAKALEEESLRREDEYKKIVAQQEQERLRQVELERQYQEEADRQYQEMLLYNQQLIEQQFRDYADQMRPVYQQPSKPSQPSVPPSSSTQPYVPPSTPSQPVANPVINPSDPCAGLSAKQRAICQSQQKSQRGRGKKFVDLQGGANDWIEALKDWNSAELHRGQMYCLPKKGSKQMTEVKKVMEKIKKGQKPPIAKRKEAPKPRGRPKKQVEGQQTLMDFLGRKK